MVADGIPVNEFVQAPTGQLVAIVPGNTLFVLETEELTAATNNFSRLRHLALLF